MSRTALAILSTENLLHNLSVIQSRVPSSKIIAMVKANAYGHGIRSVGSRLAPHVDALGVASIDEALALRKVGIKTPILLMQGIFEPSELHIASLEQFQIVLNNETQIEWLAQSHLPSPLNIWMKINTGMNRLGFSPEKALSLYRKVQGLKQVALPIKIISHFACANEKTHPLNQTQIDIFKKIIDQTDTEYSLCNSAGIFNFSEYAYDYVRPGIALYGVSPLAGQSAESLFLKPVMTVKTSLISVQYAKQGSYVGYGAQYCCPENMPIGIIAFGYGDGYPFAAPSGTPVLINQTECSLIGQVSMDMIAVDLRPVPHAKIGDPAILWGEDLSIERIAKHTSNMNWDMLTSVQNRVKFIWT